MGRMPRRLHLDCPSLQNLVGPPFPKTNRTLYAADAGGTTTIPGRRFYSCLSVPGPEPERGVAQRKSREKTFHQTLSPRLIPMNITLHKTSDAEGFIPAPDNKGKPITVIGTDA